MSIWESGGSQIQRRFSTGAVEQRLILAADAERETFAARDTIFGGFTNQDRDRSHHAVTVEWRAAAKGVTGDVAVRRDVFNRFKDATTVRASALVPVGGGFSLAGSYAEGIAQPTFFDLYGFFPNNFVGNPSLKPERSRGFEGSIRFRLPKFGASLTAYRQLLHDEIVDIFDFDTFLSGTENRDGTSRRWGVEADLAWQPNSAVRLTASYAYLKATQPSAAVTPGTSSTAMPCRRRYSISSPARANTDGSPPFRRTTRLPVRAASTSARLMRSCVQA